MVDINQRSFAGGEISAALYGRQDQVKYQTGAELIENWIALKHGGAMNRAGFGYIGPVKDETACPNLLPFQFNSTQTYVLEFGDHYLRFWSNGGRVIITSAPVWDIATPYAIGDLVSRLGIYFYCKLPNVGDAPESNPSEWQIILANFYEIPMPYAIADVIDLQITQKNDVLTITHPSYAVYELRRYTHTKWVMAQITYSSQTAVPAGVGVIAGVAPGIITTPTGLAAVGGLGGAKSSYRITAWRLIPYEESAASNFVLSSVGVASAAHPVVLTWNALGTADGYGVYKQIPATGDWHIIASVDAAVSPTFTDNGQTPAAPLRTAPEAGTGALTYTYKVTAIDATTFAEGLASSAVACNGQVPTDANPNVVYWAAAANASSYNIYREKNGVYGYVGSAVEFGALRKFKDNNIAPDITRQPPSNSSPFTSSNNYPSVAGYYQQRLILGDTNNSPSGIWATRTGEYHDLSRSTPVQDDDGFNFTIDADQVDAIRGIVDLGKLIILTEGGVHTIDGNVAGVMTPTDINRVQNNAIGSSKLKPVKINDTALYLSAVGNQVLDLRYDFQTNGYSGRDVSVFAPHLFENFTIIAWAYQQAPFSVVWLVRDDGVLLGLTYLREHDVWGWHRHTTDGYFERICVVREGATNAVYAVVRRNINGSDRRYIERMAPRYYRNLAVDAIFLDSYLTYDGRNPTATYVEIVQAGATWNFDDDFFLLAGSSAFTAGDVGRVFVLRSGSDVIRFTCTAYGNVTQLSGTVDKNVPASLRGPLHCTDWDRTASTITGLNHLEGKTVGALGDGSDLGTAVVTAGVAVFDTPCSVVHVGLPYNSDLTPLALENLQGESIIAKKMICQKASLLVDRTLGLQAGIDEDHLFEAQKRVGSPITDPQTPYTGVLEVGVVGKWDNGGRVLIRQSKPLPATILNLIRKVQIGD